MYTPQLIDLAGIPDQILNRLSAETFRCVLNQTEEAAELLMMGVVGDSIDGLSAKQVVEWLAANRTRRVLVRINSPGGLAFDGITIYNALVNHPAEVITQIEGLAASAAAIVAMAGRPVRMAENAQLFIHRAMALAIGNRAIMAETVDWLDKIDQAIAKTFAAKTGGTPAAMLRLMEGKLDGTTFAAEEAKKAGLIDEILRLNATGKGARDQGSGVRDQGSAARDLRDQHLFAEAASRLIEQQKLWESAI